MNDMHGSTTASQISGQVTLPGFEGEMGYEAIVLKPQQERFCQEFVLSGCVNAKEAYKIAYPKVTPRTAESNASRLLRNAEIKQRITQLQVEWRRRLAAKVHNYHDAVMSVDRRKLLNDGVPKPLDQWSEQEASILEFEQVSSKDGIRTLLKIPTRHQSAVEMARIMGMHKDTLAVTGKNGGPIEHSLPGLIAEIMGTTRDLVPEP